MSSAMSSAASTASTVEYMETTSCHIDKSGTCDEAANRSDHEVSDIPLDTFNMLSLEYIAPSKSPHQTTKSKAHIWPNIMPYVSLNKIGRALFTGSSSKLCKPASNTSAAEVKRKWRQEQIVMQRNLNSTINSSWRKRQITSLWCGWLLKRSSGIVGRWQRRWFELRQEPGSPCGSCEPRAVLQYTGRGSDGGEAVKRLELVTARRICEHDHAGRAGVAVGIAGRSGRVLLAAETEWAAGELMSCIASILRQSTTVQ